MAAVMMTRVHELDFSATFPADAKVISTLTLTIDPQAVSRIEQELSQLGQLRLTPVVGAFQVSLSFHDDCGKKIRLTNHHQTAQRTSPNEGDGIVMSCDPMLTDMLYQVHVDETDSKGRYTQLGVVTASTDTFTLPSDSWDRNPAVVCVLKGGFCRFGQEDYSVKWPVLNEAKVRVGSRLGLALDTDRRLHLCVDNKHEGVVARHIPDPCNFMFDLFDHCTKVSALPPTPVEVPLQH